MFRRLWRAGLVLLLPALAACSSGEPSRGFIDPRLMQAYMPLSMEGGLFTPGRWGAGIAVAPNIAVTNAHNENLLAPESILARSDYDILFYRTDRAVPLPTAEPEVGEAVIAYGQGRDGDLREARGRVVAIEDFVMPRCPDCRVQRAFSFDGDAGPGFSGGPVVDAGTGSVVGLVFGYCDGNTQCGKPRSFAFGIDTVLNEMHRLLDRPGRR